MTRLVRYIQDLCERHAAYDVCSKISSGIFAIDKVGTKDFIEDSDLLTSLSLLRSIAPSDATTEAAKLLHNLLKKRAQLREKDIRIGNISAITASKGKFIGNLCRLKYTINSGGSWPLNLPKDKQDAMWKEVETDFAPAGKEEEKNFFMVDREEWSGRLIAHNTGAARRFCWAQHHDPGRILPCRVTDWYLDSEIAKELNEKYWLCILPEEICDRVMDADQTVRRRPWLTHVSRVTSFRRNNSGESWVCCAVRRDDTFFPKLRNSLLDAGVPVYDVSSWLLQLQAGRGTP